MKPEPLKDKIKEVCFDCVDNHTSGRYYLEENILSAVEWLKLVIKATRDDMPTKLIKDCLTRDGGEIDQAFEDVIKNGTK